MAIPTKLIYKGLKANLPATREANSFYLCTDTRELYFGTELYTEPVRFYTGTKPAAPAQGVLYIEETTGAAEVWNGTAWKPVLKGYATSIGAGADDSTVPTSKAVKDYVDPLTAISPKSDRPRQILSTKDMIRYALNSNTLRFLLTGSYIAAIFV